jgi:hypothetical protein
MVLGRLARALCDHQRSYSEQLYRGHTLGVIVTLAWTSCDLVECRLPVALAMFARTSLAVVRQATRRRAAPTDAGKRFMELDNGPGKVRASARPGLETHWH